MYKFLSKSWNNAQKARLLLLTFEEAFVPKNVSTLNTADGIVRFRVEYIFDECQNSHDKNDKKAISSVYQQ